MRLFVAVDPSADARARVASAIELGKALAPGARWVQPASLHVTLFFLGQVEPERVASIGDALQAAATHLPLSFTSTGVDVFGRGRAPKVLFASIIEGVEALGALQAEVSRALVGLGFVAEARAFSPHLTLARAGRREGDPELDRAREALATLDAGESLANEVVLYESQTPRGGAVYAPLLRISRSSG